MLERRHTTELPVLPDLAAIDFTNTADVRSLTRARCRHMFGPRADGYLDEYMDAIEGLFSGQYPQYQAVDTAYHNISHTMQATLCLVELLHHRHFTDAMPRVSAKDFKRAVVAVLFHDMGYLKEAGDDQGSGAKYTHVHEARSCALAREFLADKGWPEDDIVFVENLISATGPMADLTRIDFRSETERLMGQVVCTADYIGQMSDPDYPDKLDILFHEFEESYLYQGLPRKDWPFQSYEDLLRGTPAFWRTFVHRKMTVECGSVWEHLEHPVTGENPYLEAVEKNLARIEARIAQLEGMHATA